jgi:prevent-host-death family protein
MSVWNIQDGKARFSELIKKSGDSAQFITLHGKPTAVVVSQEEYSRLVKPKPSFLDFMQASPLADVDIDFRIERNTSRPRKVDL